MNRLVYARGQLDAEPVFNDIVALLSADGAETAVYTGAAGPACVPRRQLVSDIEVLASAVTAADWAGAEARSAWVSCRDRYLFVLAALGCLRTGPVALAETQETPSTFEAMAAACPPAVVVTDDAGTTVARWAQDHDVPVRLVGRPDAGWQPSGRPARGTGPEPVLQFFTSGTTGPVKCVSIRGPQLMAAITGVAGRLKLAEADVSLSLAPLTHTLGFITTVLVALASGGTVSFADPLRPRSLHEAVSGTGPTWCAASPSALKLVLALTGSAGLGWPALRFLRSSAAPLPAELAADLERRFGVPAINAYAMTEAPGEIASQDLDGYRCPGTAGRPTLCEVRVGPDRGGSPAGEPGEIWIRGPNVAAAPSPGEQLPWLRTEDIGLLDANCFLRITGRSNDIINQGGLKIWPPDVEAAVLGHPEVTAALAFPVPHRGLGEIVGLAVVPRAGSELDRAAVRRLLMAGLPREKWPATIVICDQLPLTGRGKLSRRAMSRLLGLEPR
jgi:acyl-CoA synthetase (AMP-forming)/AMP-acid ligase II